MVGILMIGINYGSKANYIMVSVIENQQPLDFQDIQFCLKPKPTMFQIPTIVPISSSDAMNYNNKQPHSSHGKNQPCCVII